MIKTSFQPRHPIRAAPRAGRYPPPLRASSHAFRGTWLRPAPDSLLRRRTPQGATRAVSWRSGGTHSSFGIICGTVASYVTIVPRTTHNPVGYQIAGLRQLLAPAHVDLLLSAATKTLSIVADRKIGEPGCPEPASGLHAETFVARDSSALLYAVLPARALASKARGRAARAGAAGERPDECGPGRHAARPKARGKLQ